MDKRRVILIGGVLLLAGVNAWYWSAKDRSTPVRSPQTARSGFAADDFRLRTTPSANPAELKQVQRNLFQPKIVVVAKPVEKPKPPPEPPPKTPEELAEEAARAELAQYKFIGAIFRETKGQALLARGDQTYTVGVGDKVGRFTVETIATDTVALRDSATNVAGALTLSGK